MLWSPIKVVAEAPYGSDAVIDRDGNVTVVWADFAPPREVHALRHPAGGRWSRATTIGHGWRPRLAVDGSGTVTAVWRTLRDEHMAGIEAARCPLHHEWSEPVVLAPGTATSRASAHSLAANSSGDVVAAWSWSDRGGESAIHAAWRPRGGPWRETVALTPEDGSHGPHVGIDGVGRAVVLYEVATPRQPRALVERVRMLSGRWAKPVVVAAEGYSAILAVDPAGHAAVVFSPDFSAVRATSRLFGGEWSPPELLGPRQVDWYALSVGPTETAVAAIAGSSHGGWVDLVERRREGPWSRPTRIFENGAFDFLSVARNAVGDTFLAWGSDRVLGAYRRAAGPWEEPVELSPLDRDPAALEVVVTRIARNGDVVLLWKREDRPLSVRIRSASA